MVFFNAPKLSVKSDTFDHWSAVCLPQRPDLLAVELPDLIQTGPALLAAALFLASARFASSDNTVAEDQLISFE